VKLSVYFGESDRAGPAALSDALLDLFAARELRSSVLLRGIEGFGAKQRLRSDRLLTLSEDLPLVAVAVDETERIEATLPAVEALVSEGLVTLERTTGTAADENVKLTVYCGRSEYAPVVDLLHSHGVEGATVLLGVDGTMHGERRRARFFAANTGVPLMVVAVGAGERIGAALEDLHHPLCTLERLSSGPAGTPWEKLTVYSSEATGLHLELVRRLRAAGAAGATCARGIWGYHRHGALHGDRLLALRRRVPVLTTVVDVAERTAEWFEIASGLTAPGAIVTREGLPIVSVRQKGKPGAGIE
jgi:PII-like signaling protein